jgi:hypothetical protein
MYVASSAVRLVLEVVVLNIFEAVAHFGIAAAERLAPQHRSVPLNRNRHR